MVKQGVCLFLLLAVSAWAKPLVVKTQNPTPDIVIACEVFAAPAKLETDVAPALQAVIDKVSKAGGGTVFMPVGEYTFASCVVVREGVTLRGDRKAGDGTRSTLLRITADKGSENAPATFSIERGSGLVGLTFWYPEQRVPDPVPYPWTVRNAVMPANDNQTVTDCTFVNSWKAICIGPDGNELHTFRNLQICALKTGISIDSTTDIGRLSEVTVSPQVWSASGLSGTPAAAALRAYLLANDTVAVDIGRSDWEYIWRLKVEGYRRGLVVRKGVQGTTNAVMADSDLSGCACAFEVSALNQVGFSAYRCAFTGTEQAFLGAESFDAVVQFHSCRFEGSVAMRGAGVYAFQACDLAGAVDVVRGQLLVQDSVMRQVKVGAEVSRVRLLGCDEKLARITDESTNGDVMVSPRNGSAQIPPVVAPVPLVCPRPKADTLFTVTDFGASETNQDNAAAFQAALDQAGKNRGGGTVYVPAGLYKFRSDITVPTGVELRGCFDVPHHTVSAGSVLMAYHNRGKEDGYPFVSLKPCSGLRGLTFWYPEQPLKAPEPYPWTVRSLGKQCWIRDVTIGNTWQGVDFATHRSDGHRISYLAGAMFRRGLFVGNCKDTGWVEDVQFNPHYSVRLPEKLPCTYGDKPGDAGGRVIQFQREHLEGLVFKDCREECLRGTFLYAAYDGLAFRGKVKAQVLMHGTDTGSRAVVFEAESGSQVDFALAQLVSLGDWAKAAIVTLPGNKGDVRFYNSQMWAGPATAVLEGSGKVRLEQFNTLTGPIGASGGRLEAVNGVFDRELPAHVAVSGSAEAEVIGTDFERGPLRVAGDRKQVRQCFNSASVRPRLVVPAGDAPTVYVSSFEPGEPAAAADTVVANGGGIRKVSANQCGAVARDDAHGGGHAVWLRGVSEDPAYSFVYHVVHDRPVFVMPDTTMTYWMKALNENGRSTALDLCFADGTVLRESGTPDTEGRSTFPGVKKGAVGVWTKIEVPLGQFAGKTITIVMAAYDTREGGGPFSVLFDDLRIAPELPPAVWQIRLSPVGGRVPVRTDVTIVKDASVQVRYTLDGSEPDATSPLYTLPIRLTMKGVVELRYTPLKADGGLSKQVFGAVYVVE